MKTFPWGTLGTQLVVSASLAVAIGVPRAANAQDCNWSTAFNDKSLANVVIRAAVVFDDDGPGPHASALYVAGDINKIGDQRCYGFAKWDGHNWTPLAPLWYGDNPGSGYSLAVFNGQLYVGGVFASTVQSEDLLSEGLLGIAKWTGSAWQSVGGGFTELTPTSRFGVPAVLSLVVHNDNSGAALYAGGVMNKASGVAEELHGIAKWNGSTWSGLGSDPNFKGLVYGDNEQINCLESFDPDGSGPNPAELYAVGNFSTVPGVPAAGSIAKWNGSAWSNPNRPAQILAGANLRIAKVFDDDGAGPHLPALYIGGGDIGVGSTGVWRLQNGAWTQAFSLDLPLIAQSMTVFDDGSGSALYVGSDLEHRNDLQPSIGRAVVKWNGSVAQEIGSGLTWRLSSEGGSELALQLNALVPFTDANGAGLFALGSMGNPAGFMKRAGGTWQAPIAANEYGGPVIGGMVGVDPDGAGPLPARLYAATSGPGHFGPIDLPGADPDRVSWVGQFDGSQWTLLNEGLIRDHSDNHSSGGIHILAWLDLGQGPSLYAAGVFSGTTANPGMNSLARWTGSSWVSVGGGVRKTDPLNTNNSILGDIRAVTVYDPDGSGPQAARLVVAGDFDSAGGVPAVNIAQWDGASWSTLAGSGTTLPNNARSIITELAVFDDDGAGPHQPALYAGGKFTTIGGVSSPGIGRWNGSSWSSLGSGIATSQFDSEQHLLGLQVFNDGSGPVLVVTGMFTSAGGVPCKGVARWNGSSWAAMDAGVIPDYPFLRSMVVWDDGTGPVLYASDFHPFPDAFDDNLNPYPGPVYIAKWTGTQWTTTTAGSGFSTTDRVDQQTQINFLTTVGSGRGSSLYAGGSFVSVDGIPSVNLARWTCGTACPADFNGDAVRDVADLFGYINAWLAKTSNADFNHDSVVDVADLFGFINAWLAGC